MPRSVRALALIVVLVVSASARGLAQEHPAIQHAKRLFDLLQQQKLDEVAKEFTVQMTADLPPEKFRDVWVSFRKQVGTFGAFIDQQVALPGNGITAAILGCKFEKASVNVIFAFDAENKVAGLTLVPRKE